MAKGEMKVFQVLDENGKLIRLVEAENVKGVKEIILRSVDVHDIEEASGMTVSRGIEEGLKVERA